jgi:hypothetical protein
MNREAVKLTGKLNDLILLLSFSSLPSGISVVAIVPKNRTFKLLAQEI